MGKQVVTSIRVDEGLWRDAKMYALKNRMTVSDFLDKLLREKLKKAN